MIVLPADPALSPEMQRRTRAALCALGSFCRARGITGEDARFGRFDASAFLDFLRADYASWRRPRNRGLVASAAWRHVALLGKAWTFWRARGEVAGDPFGPLLRQSAPSAEFETLVARVPRTSAGRQRHVAVLRLGRECGLHVAEIAALDLADYDADRGRLRIRGKWLALSPPTRAALDAYLAQGRALSLTNTKERAFFLNRYRGGRLAPEALGKHLNMLGVRWRRVVERYRPWVNG